MSSHPSHSLRCLVLPSSLTVANPAQVRATGVLDPEIRFAQTVHALSFWLTRQTRFTDIIVVDSSGEDLTPLQRAMPAAPGKSLEFLSFDATERVRREGRTRGELMIMDHLRTHSAAIRAHRHFAKGNARLHIGNLDALFRNFPEVFDMAGRLSHNLTWFGTPFFAANRDFFFEKILPYSLAHADDSRGINTEHVYARSLLRAVADGARFYPFAVEPKIVGRRGLDNAPYQRSFLRQAVVTLVTRAYNRAYDNVVDSTKPHPQEISERRARGG